MAILYLTQTDLDERLQTASCCIGSLAYTTSRDFRYGMKCANHNLEKLFLITVISEILKCYIPLDPTDPDETDNCITELQAQYLFEQISTNCKTCYESINHTY